VRQSPARPHCRRRAERPFFALQLHMTPTQSGSVRLGLTSQVASSGSLAVTLNGAHVNLSPFSVRMDYKPLRRSALRCNVRRGVVATWRAALQPLCIADVLCASNPHRPLLRSPKARHSPGAVPSVMCAACDRFERRRIHCRRAGAAEGAARAGVPRVGQRSRVLLGAQCHRCAARRCSNATNQRWVGARGAESRAESSRA
jgi:hypothetical protein